MTSIPAPLCHGVLELHSAIEERARINQVLQSGAVLDFDSLSPTSKHISLGLAITPGSAVGEHPPSREQCIAAFATPNSVGLSAGARAWAKHAHRSMYSRWWGSPKGSVASLNAGALEIFEKIMQAASWRNLHWLPHMILVYEVRVVEGYGMRWSQDRTLTFLPQVWVFRGFVEPMMENGHQLRWRH